jgi:tRNA(fMet)-specific endonuclease VapC
MALYLFDTDILSLLHAGDPVVRARVDATPVSDYAIIGITVEEQLNGWLGFIRRATRPDQIENGYRELGLTVGFLSRFPMIPFLATAVTRFEALKRQKLNVRGNDLRIAAIALEAGAVVVTRNVRDFGRVPGLVVEDWSQPATATPPPPPPAVPPTSPPAP